LPTPPAVEAADSKLKPVVAGSSLLWVAPDITIFCHPGSIAMPRLRHLLMMKNSFCDLHPLCHAEGIFFSGTTGFYVEKPPSE
jgi:hypothetical protein